MNVTTEPGIGQVFAALADPTRRRLLELLGPRPACSATALAIHLPVSRQAVVQHLAVLESAGLVASHRAGREVLFSVRPGQLAVTATWLTDRAGAWQASLQALKRAAEADHGPTRSVERTDEDERRTVREPPRSPGSKPERRDEPR